MARKFNGHCEKCHKSLCLEHVYSYVDGNNIAITNNAPYLCKECYENTYHTKIKDEVEIFKDNMISNLENLKIHTGIKEIKIEKIINYIRNF